MNVWPILVDSRPAFVRGRGRSSSLLLSPLGANTLLDHLISALTPVTGHHVSVVAPEDADPAYASWIHAISPNANVQKRQDKVLEGHELADALLIVDPACMPSGGFEFAELMMHHAAEPRVSHHLVAFETAVGGTKERVSFDTDGQIRGIHRHYEQATWPFITGIAAAILPCSCGVPADGRLPASLESLRQLLVARGVPSRDVPVTRGALDLSVESGILAANEQLILKATQDRSHGRGVHPLYVGSGHDVHPTARLVGPVIVHGGARLEEHTTVVGPAVIGSGAHIAAGAVIAHAVIGPDSIVAAGQTVRDRAWFDEGVTVQSPAAPVPFTERLARHSLEAQAKTEAPVDHQPARCRYDTIKRAIDATAAAMGLIALSPVLALVAAAIKIESGSPIFYGDKREGWKGVGFGCWKFRTMYTGAHLAQRQLKALDQTDGPHFKVAHDPRVTKVGRLLRFLNLDEVPQLWNVLVGEMSLVGPRPSPFRENQVCVPWREARLSVRPGITGFWQVCRHDRAAGDFHQWIEYDLLYVQYLSFVLDLKILAATLFTLGGKAGYVPASWLVDATPPTVPAWTLPSPSPSPAVPVRDLSSTDRISVS